MIDRKHIESILSLNGLESDSPDEEIKSLLISARWHEQDVETALVVLREDPKKRHQHIDSVHNVFNSNDKIQPDTLNALLGIDVEVAKVSNEHQESLNRAYRMQIFSMAVISIFFAASALLSAMWFFKVGIFHSQW